MHNKNTTDYSFPTKFRQQDNGLVEGVKGGFQGGIFQSSNIIVNST